MTLAREITNDYEFIAIAQIIKERENLSYADIAARTGNKVSESTVQSFFKTERWNGIPSSRRLDLALAICNALGMTIKIEY
ncbi:helix-turn-helix transcriptional regulator [Fodinisporobacter ferrooxydans]|uniref:Helix-turn-helix transcriptional regulator n=1 Tax=Fodinisporobacter ferrooxydans TaxID=2901836 RepID=A0ABY4CKE6_9BACL|nr:helix-turn-helix transcriptional regulator [Alicyclobacillaceae bacterium MYW30-H2]